MANVKEVEWQGGIYNIADETARGEAQQARALANTAQASADRALTAAGNAQNAAGAAQDTADDAQNTADDAKTLTNGIFQTLFSGTEKYSRENIHVTTANPFSFTMPGDGAVLVNAFKSQVGFSLYLLRGSSAISVFSNYAGERVSGVLFGMFKKNDVVTLSTNAPYEDEGFLINHLSAIC